MTEQALQDERYRVGIVCLCASVHKAVWVSGLQVETDAELGESSGC